jgi:hypothetical protein
MPSRDQSAKSEIAGIPRGKKKAFVYAPASNDLAVGNSIHAVLAMNIGVTAGCAGFLENSGYAIFIIHWPASPVDAGGAAYLTKVQQKIRSLGFSSVAIRKK